MSTGLRNWMTDHFFIAQHNFDIIQIFFNDSFFFWTSFYFEIIWHDNISQSSTMDDGLKNSSTMNKILVSLIESNLLFQRHTLQN